MYGIHKCTHIEVFEEELAWAIDKQRWQYNVIKNCYTTKNLKNKAIYNIKILYTLQLTLSNVF